jgi:hypothetical protein
MKRYVLIEVQDHEESPPAHIQARITMYEVQPGHMVANLPDTVEAFYSEVADWRTGEAPTSRRPNPPPTTGTKRRVTELARRALSAALERLLDAYGFEGPEEW